MIGCIFTAYQDRILQFNGVAGSRSITAFSAAEFDDVEQFGEAYRVCVCVCLVSFATIGRAQFDLSPHSISITLLCQSFCMDFKNQLRDRRAEDEATNLQLGNVVSTKHAASSNSPGGDVPESSTADVELSAEQLQLRQAAVEQQEAADEAAAGAAFSSQTMPARVSSPACFFFFPFLFGTDKGWYRQDWRGDARFQIGMFAIVEYRLFAVDGRSSQQLPPVYALPTGSRGRG